MTFPPQSLSEGGPRTRNTMRAATGAILAVGAASGLLALVMLRAAQAQGTVHPPLKLPTTCATCGSGNPASTEPSLGVSRVVSTAFGPWLHREIRALPWPAGQDWLHEKIQAGSLEVEELAHLYPTGSSDCLHSVGPQAARILRK